MEEVKQTSPGPNGGAQQQLVVPGTGAPDRWGTSSVVPHGDEYRSQNNKTNANNPRLTKKPGYEGGLLQPPSCSMLTPQAYCKQKYSNLMDKTMPRQGYGWLGSRRR